MLLILPPDVVDWWKEYYKDLLNPTDRPSSEEAGPGDLGTGSRISKDEAVNVVKKLSTGPPVVDEICQESLRL